MPNKAGELFTQGFNCSQAVFAAWADELGLGRETALKIASGFGAGMGRRQEVCGAVTGAGMVLGLKFGHSDGADQGGKERVYARVRDLHEAFSKVHGSTSCRQLLGVDMTTEEGRQAMKDRDLMKTICLKCVETAYDLTVQTLQEEK